MRSVLLTLIILSGIFLLIYYVILPTQPTQNDFQELHLVGVLAANDLRLNKFAGLKDGLVDYGFNLKEEVQFLIKNAKSSRQDLLPLAEELVGAGVEVIVTTGRVETEVAKKITENKKIPVVFMGLTAINPDNLVTSLLFPQEGLTGVQNDHASLSGKRLELLTKLVPETKRVLVVYDPKVIPSQESLLAVETAAKKLNLHLELASASTLTDISTIFARNLKDIDAVLLLPSFFLESEGAGYLVPQALQKGLPVMGVEHGTKARLFAVYGITPYDQGKQAARILTKILSGQSVEDIPVEPPSKLKLTVDLGVAQELNLKIDSAILRYAEIIYPEVGDINEN